MGAGVETRSRASSSNPKKYRRTNSGARRNGDHVNVEEEANQDSKEDPVDVEEAKQPSEEESQTNRASNQEEDALVPEGKSDDMDHKKRRKRRRSRPGNHSQEK